jgi:uncharacterized protein YdhG (YjbR/CyaY superfamily)
VSSAEVDAWLAQLPSDEMRTALAGLRAQIRAELPDGEEGISYSMPAMRYGGRPLVSYAAWKGHCSLYPMSYAVMDALRDDLAGFEVEKGTIRFKPTDPLPGELVARIVRARIAEIDARVAAAKASRRRTLRGGDQ